MGARVAAPFRKNGKSIWWYRVGVPARCQEAIGKTELVGSLFTADLAVARLRHSAKIAEIRQRFANLDQQVVANIGDLADKIVSTGFDELASRHIRFHSDNGPVELTRALDNVTYAMLRVLAFRVRLDWGGAYAEDARAEAF